jgi:hypothetical protein
MPLEEFTIEDDSGEGRPFDAIGGAHYRSLLRNELHHLPFHGTIVGDLNQVLGWSCCTSGQIDSRRELHYPRAKFGSH